MLVWSSMVQTKTKQKTNEKKIGRKLNLHFDKHTNKSEYLGHITTVAT